VDDGELVALYKQFREHEMTQVEYVAQMDALLSTVRDELGE
jgi:hypothetical protein